MGKVSLDKFLSYVERSKLLEPEQFATFRTDYKRQATLAQLDDAHDCAERLTSAGLLTAWQCKKLLEGRHRGFFLGRYKLLDHLGTGGMSSVYLAEHVLMQRLVAIKVLPQHRVGDAAYLARFHLEAQAAAALDHPNIVRAYDLANDDKIHYLVMEYVEGHDLSALVAHDGPLDYAAAAHCIAQAAAGLAHAHQCGLVHRDVKPANLLLDLKGTVKILDMGLAKFTPAARLAGQLPVEEHVLGTADYLAPEQAVNSQTVDHRADIYALGCTLYFLLTGHPPFASGTSLERMTAHQQQAAPSLLVDRPDAPAPLVEICRRMMEKSPLARYQSATEVELALRQWLDSLAVERRANPAALAGRAVPRRPAANGGSKSNLVSGSTSDLKDLAAAGPPFGAALRDTDPNLMRATVKMSTVGQTADPAAAMRSSASEVLHVAGASASRPAQPNPPPAQPPVQRPAQTVRPHVESPPAVETEFESVVTAAPAKTNRSLSAHRGDFSRTVSIILFSALLMVAALLALIVLGR